MHPQLMIRLKSKNSYIGKLVIKQVKYILNYNNNVLKNMFQFGRLILSVGRDDRNLPDRT